MNSRFVIYLILLVIASTMQDVSARPSVATDSTFHLNESLEPPFNSPAKKVAMGFYRPSKVPRPSAHEKQALAALVRLEGSVSHCSGARISRAGHILTAAHCLKNSLGKASRSDLSELELVELDQTANRYQEQEVPFTVEKRAARLLYAGKGFIWGDRNPSDISKMAGDATLSERFRALTVGDWAILVSNGGKMGSCLKASAQIIPDGEPLWAFGYPASAQRSNQQDSYGKAIYIIYGEAVRDVIKSEFYAQLNPASREVYRPIFQSAIDSGDLILSNMDSYTGFSGGPAINSQGELVGVRNTSGSNQNTFRNNSTQTISIKKIFQDLRSAGIDPGSFFDCPAAE